MANKALEKYLALRAKTLKADVIRKNMNNPQKNRWKLFAICAICTVTFASLFTVRSAFRWNFSLSSYFTVLFWTLMGPFSLGFTTNTGLMNLSLMGFPNIFAMFLHPIKPNSTTALLTIIAFLCWLFLGIFGSYINST